MPMASHTQRPRVLIVDDEWLIADLMANILKESGFDVIGPASRVSTALELIETDPPAAAILDVTLGSEPSFRIARALAERGVPFLFMTGYCSSDLPAEFTDRPILGKPVELATLGAHLRGLLR